MVSLIFLIILSLALIISGSTEVSYSTNIGGLQKFANIVSVNFTLALIIVAIFEGSLLLGIFAPALFWFLPGITQNLTLLLTGRGCLVSPASWIITIISLGALICMLIFGNIINI